MEARSSQPRAEHGGLRALAAGVAACLAIAVAGCRHGGGSDCHASLVNAVPRAAGVRALVDGHALLGPVDYGAVTDYRAFVPGRYSVRIVSADRTLCREDVTLAKGRSDTVIVAPAASPREPARLVAVRWSPKSAGNAPIVVFVNAAAGGGKVDILVNGVAAAQDLAPGASSPAVRVSAGACDVRAIVAGNPQRPVADGAMIVDGTDRYLCVLMGGGGEPTVLRTYGER